MQIYRSLLDHAPGPVTEFRAELEALDADTQKAGLAAERLSRHYSAGVVARFALGQGLALLLGAPLALCGIVLHVVPYQLTAAAVRLIPHTDEEEATDKIAAGLVLYPLAWALEAWAAYAIGGKLALIGFLVALLPAGFFALALAGAARARRPGGGRVPSIPPRPRAAAPPARAPPRARREAGASSRAPPPWPGGPHEPAALGRARAHRGGRPRGLVLDAGVDRAARLPGGADRRPAPRAHRPAEPVSLGPSAPGRRRADRHVGRHRPARALPGGPRRSSGRASVRCSASSCSSRCDSSARASARFRRRSA